MDEQAMWAAILERDERLDGRLYYGVRSTGVVCRPGCPSRAPARNQVAFFERLDDAIEAGFRPCRRCRPEQSLSALRHHAEVQRACGLLHEDPTRSLTDVARAFCLSPRALQRAFQWWLGVSPREYRAACRLSHFRSNGKRGDTTAAALDAGYPSLAGLYEQGGVLGMTPATHRAGAPGVCVRYATTKTALGPVLLAATDAGVCALHFGDAPEALADALRGEFPDAELAEDPQRLGPWLRLVEAYAAGRARTVALPLDVHGTLFQLRVWSVLRTIPPGESRTYGEIAAALGHPGAARAVGRACATNPVALAIPCHRVAGGSNGGGYRWGIERKQALRSLEETARPAPARG